MRRAGGQVFPVLRPCHLCLVVHVPAGWRLSRQVWASKDAVRCHGVDRLGLRRDGVRGQQKVRRVFAKFHGFGRGGGDVPARGFPILVPASAVPSRFDSCFFVFVRRKLHRILFVLPIEPALWLEPKGHVSVVCRHCGGGTHAYRLPVGCPGEGAEAHDRRRQRWRGWHVRGQRDEEQPVGPSREQHQQQQGLVLEPDHASVVFGRGHGPVHQV